MARGFSPGFGREKALSGLLGRENGGLIQERPDAAVSFNPGVELLHTNQNRKWAVIQNLDTNPVQVSFDTDTGVAPTFVLDGAPVAGRSGGTLQIDENLPWCGPVYCASVTGSVTYMEASVQP